MPSQSEMRVLSRIFALSELSAELRYTTLPRQTSRTPFYPILSRLSRPRKDAPQLEASCCGRLRLPAEAAAIAANE
jgi:hypothetical protein